MLGKNNLTLYKIGVFPYSNMQSCVNNIIILFNKCLQNRMIKLIYINHDKNYE